MQTNTRLIQPGALQIMPTNAQSVRRSAESTRSFAEVLDAQSKTEIRSETAGENNGLVEDRPIEESESQPGATDSEEQAEHSSGEASTAETHETKTETGGQSKAEADGDDEPGVVKDPHDGEPQPVTDQQPMPAEADADLPDSPPVPAPAEAKPAVQAEQAQEATHAGSSVGSKSDQAETSVKSEAMIGLSRKSDAAREQLSGAKVTAEPVKADATTVAREQMAQPSRESQPVVQEPVDDSAGDFREQLRRQVLEGSSKQESQQSAPNEFTSRTDARPVSADAKPNTQPESPQPVVQNATPSTVVPAAVLGAPAVPDAIRSVLERIQGVRSMMPGASSAQASGAQANPGSVTAIGSTSGASIGADSGSPGKLGVIRGQASGTDRNAVIAQVQRGLASMLRSGGGDMTIRLRPDHLGELKIRVHAEDGAVRATFETKTEGARDAIEQGLGRLREQLESKGVRVGELRVDHRGEGAGEPGGQTQGDQSGGQHERQQASEHSGTTSGVDAHAEHETQNEQPRGIWTELGLDAVA